ncbi:MAG TPA: bifunctional aspartate kinase/homoserine dehydrogenase I [Candidatus Bacteroides merdipullorum]|uniref:Bifunctional aspartate kinase/homoserine dehydrogenase I n=1 Tax=Candidatus Bacteroides merdipullorum TaxID=2838474 RepID=A0A9D2A501_9BACE|nr:bifunctional aspartate kinase/homoserine dehydrogenase I [Candidatus Bacteroides merdipullorum]
MKVMKFGGTSVGSVESILSVKRIVEAEAGREPVIVVVSALGGITDKLIKTSRMAAAGDAAYEDEFREIVSRHVEMVKRVIPEFDAQMTMQRRVGELLNELKDIFQGIYLIKDLSQKTSDTIVSYGERLSSIIAAQLTGARWYDSRSFIKTEKKFSKHVLDTELTNRLVRETFSELPPLVLVPGFIATDKDTGEVTNLGRGGSDYTAAIIAAALDADSLEIWTDVDGFMTADPRVISTAYTINELSYVEATELCNFGAKVVYPPTIYPVCHKNIPILIKNTFNPAGAGTVIKQTVSSPQGKAIKGISSINDTSLITVQGLGMVGVIGVNYRIFKALAKNGISVFLVSQASSENSTSIGVRNADADLACSVLTEEFAKEIEMGEISPMQVERDLATVAIVGENMKHTPGIAGKLFGTLGRNGINVIACAQGASETNISFVVDSRYLRKSLNVIHDSFFLSEYQVLNLFICGIGTVGGKLIEQIRSQRQRLMQENGLQLNVVGIADASRSMFSREGFDLSRFREELKEKGQESDTQRLRDGVIGMNIFNSVFVDCTASPDVAGIYEELLRHNISVVAANKIAASSEYENYLRLKQTARQRGVKYLFETNVGAGLPIINTINDLIHSGDKILKIEAVLSGTLNYIFNQLSADVPFSQTIRMAQQERYSEPDPRIDLSGKDVIRKLVILAREAGYRIEQGDVERHLFVPDDFFEGSLDDFWRKVPSLDADFEARRRRLEAEHKHWRFVARLDGGRASVGLMEVAPGHPFYGLEGSNNIILLTTERYREYPMMIQGYGAGADVTAAGVFADIMSIANV